MTPLAVISRGLSIGAFACLAAAAVVAQAPEGAESRPESRPETRFADPLRYMAARVAESVNLDPPGLVDDYATELLNFLPFLEIRALMVEMRIRHGRVEEIEEIKRGSPTFGVFRLKFEKKVAVRMELAIDGDTGLVSGVVFDEPLPVEDSREKALFAMEAFYGRTASALFEVADDGSAKVFDARNEEQEFMFPCLPRILIATALADELLNGTRKLEDVVRIEPSDKSPRYGRLARYPDGAPVTIHSLAAAMLAEADDTATDALLRVVGRERVVREAERCGAARRPNNAPFLTTRQAYVLKYGAFGDRVDGYGTADLEARRALLDEAAKTSPFALEPTLKPRFVDTVGWYASSREVVSALVRFRALTEKAPASALREIFALNRGLPIGAEHFPYVGYVGGFEPGALGTAWLLERPNGRRFVFVAAWNEPLASLEERRFLAWTRRYLELCAASL